MDQCDTYSKELMASMLSTNRDVDLFGAIESYRDERMAEK
jgi:hypothetical protein